MAGRYPRPFSTRSFIEILPELERFAITISGFIISTSWSSMISAPVITPGPSFDMESSAEFLP